MSITELNYPTSYNRELILDLTLEAFSVYNFDHTDEDAAAPKVHDYLPVRKTVKEATETDIFDANGTVVEDGSGASVTTTVKITTNRTRDSRLENFKFLTSQGSNITLSEYKDYDFVDFATYHGTGFDYSSFLVTGYSTFEDFTRTKQAIYLIVMCERTETIYSLVSGVVTPIIPSSCKIQARWEWNNSTAQGKWGTEFEAYRLFLPQAASPTAGDDFDYGPIVIETKNKLRGSGKALSLYIRSSTGKDLKLLGWGIQGYIVDNP